MIMASHMSMRPIFLVYIVPLQLLHFSDHLAGLLTAMGE